VVLTGDGKGKTTSALGMVFRAWGHGLHPCVVQFIKSEEGRWGETKAAQRLGIEWHTLGDGFVFDPENDGQARKLARQGWEVAKVRAASGECDLLVLDEFTYPISFGWIDSAEVLAWLTTERPKALHVIITGREASDELVCVADLVSEVQKIKHPYDAGMRGQKGIEF